MDQDLETFEDDALKTYLTNEVLPQLFAYYHSLKVKDMQHKF